MTRRPRRLPSAVYTGFNAYFITATTHRRQLAFVNDAFCAFATEQLFRHAEACSLDVTAYCLMPDHAHILLTATTPAAEVLCAVRGWRQKTGYRWKQDTACRLWQEGIWDYVLRDDEDPIRVAAYVVSNPVRAGLVTTPDAYRYSGSSRYQMAELLEAMQMRPRRGSRPA